MHVMLPISAGFNPSADRDQGRPPWNLEGGVGDEDGGLNEA